MTEEHDTTPAPVEPTPAELEDPRAASTPVEQKRTPPCPPEPETPRLLTDAEAVAIRAYLPECKNAERAARMTRELAAYDAAHARIQDESEMPS